MHSNQRNNSRVSHHSFDQSRVSSTPVHFGHSSHSYRNHSLPTITENGKSNGFFHAYQQFQNIVKAVEMQEIDAQNQIDEFIIRQYQNPNTTLPGIESSQRVAFTLNIHGNEFRHMIFNLPSFGVKILEQLSRIHRRTECEISFTDRRVGKNEDITSIKFDGLPKTIEVASAECLNLLPLHIGMHLTDLKEELKSVDLKKKLADWMDKKVYNYPDVSFHFVNKRHSTGKEQEQYDYVVLRNIQNKAEELVNAVTSFSKLVFNKLVDNRFSAGYRLPVADRVWFLGFPEGSLVEEIGKKSGTIIKYSNFDSSKTIDFNIFGQPRAIIQAGKLLRRVAQVKMQFEINDMDLQEPFGRHPNVVNQLIVEKSVLITYERGDCQTYLGYKQGHVRHKITLRTSYENRRMLYHVRQDLLKSHLIGKMSADGADERLLFDTHLQKILSHLQADKMNTSKH